MNYKVSAYLRVKDEINTIEACLNSIDGLFDRVVIIHSNEDDDGTVAFINEYSKSHSAIEIHEYPHAVIPSHHECYKSKYAYKNSLAAYNNFGLSFFEPEEYVVKIDADQVYMTEFLKKGINEILSNAQENTKYALRGYNTFIYKGQLVKYAPVPVNGNSGERYFVKRKYIDKFVQQGMFEHLLYKDIKFDGMWNRAVWFHFMKNLKTQGVIRENDTARNDEIEYLSQEEAELYNTHIHPLLINSPYCNLKLEKN